ncbi:MAG TPA: AMP nucleosidase [Spirochaetota bacterium]|nr:AMP nucleosidase [Spirochaetota bacterium]HRZ26627.1 AMP nucleosidase [Spirochaetota bacterium]HSA14364.1 AMP nucleosidase [Spirochaetota bacterium]
MTKTLRPDTYARSTLERYTGSPIGDFGSNILLVNFQRYIEHFSKQTGCPIISGYWSVVHDRERDLSIINFGVGSPSAGIVAHCLSFLDQVQSVLMLGMCGGIDDELEIGQLLIPTASVRDEGTSKHYLQQNVPAQPAFWINRICERVIKEEMNMKPVSGIMMTTDYRMWEFDNEFVDYVLKHRILAIDMEIATLFSVAYALNLPIGAIMLISDMPLKKGGIKSKESAESVFDRFTEQHFNVGLKTIEEIRKHSSSRKVDRLRSEW